LGIISCIFCIHLAFNVAETDPEHPVRKPVVKHFLRFAFRLLATPYKFLFLQWILIKGGFTVKMQKDAASLPGRLKVAY
jgi:hypothetical protein